MATYRIGQIVPSSNTTRETEIPAMLNARRECFPDERFTFRAARMRMMQVMADELAKMDEQDDRCALEPNDARCDVPAYAGLVAIMAQGAGYHRVSEARLRGVVEQSGAPTPILSSAGALIEGIHAPGTRRVAIVTPYMKPLTREVIDYIESEDIEVTDSISLEVADNLAVGRLEPHDLSGHAARLDSREADAVVLSTCVQMPSLPAIQPVEGRLGKPVSSAAALTVHRMLKTLGLQARVPNAGRLLTGAY